jgi:hypothetical protein
LIDFQASNNSFWTVWSEKAENSYSIYYAPFRYISICSISEYFSEDGVLHSKNWFKALNESLPPHVEAGENDPKTYFSEKIFQTGTFSLSVIQEALNMILGTPFAQTPNNRAVLLKEATNQVLLIVPSF